MTGKAGDPMHDGPLEAAVWLRFADEDSLAAGYAALAAEWDFPPAPTPEEGRRMLALRFDASAEEIAKATDLADLLAAPGDAEPLAVDWTNAYLLGTIRGAVAAAICDHAGVPALVYAMRVQPAGAAFPSTMQPMPGQDDDDVVRYLG